MSNALYIGLTSLLTLAICAIIALVAVASDINPMGAFICVGGLLATIPLRIISTRGR